MGRGRPCRLAGPAAPAGRRGRRPDLPPGDRAERPAAGAGRLAAAALARPVRLDGRRGRGVAGHTRGHRGHPAARPDGLARPAARPAAQPSGGGPSLRPGRCRCRDRLRDRRAVRPVGLGGAAGRRHLVVAQRAAAALPAGRRSPAPPVHGARPQLRPRRGYPGGGGRPRTGGADRRPRAGHPAAGAGGRLPGDHGGGAADRRRAGGDRLGGAAGAPGTAPLG